MVVRRFISGPLIEVVAPPAATMPELTDIRPAGVTIAFDASASVALVPCSGLVDGATPRVGLLAYPNAALPLAYEAEESVTGDVVGVAGYDGYPLVVAPASATRRVVLYQDSDESARYRLVTFDGGGLVVAEDVYDGPELFEFADFSENRLDWCVSGGALYLLEPRDSAIVDSGSSPYPALQRVTKRDPSTLEILAEYVPPDGDPTHRRYWGVTPRTGGGVDLWIKSSSTAFSRRSLDADLVVDGSDSSLSDTATYRPSRIRKRAGSGYTVCGLKVGSPGSTDDVWYSATGLGHTSDIAVGLAIPSNRFWLDIRPDDSLILGDWQIGAAGLFDFMVAILETDGNLLKP